MKDILPDYLKYVAGDLDVAFDLDIGQTKEFEIKVQVVPAGDLPNNAGLFCVVNTAEARFDDQYNKDTAQVCIEKGEVKGFVTEELPEAGPKENLALFFGSTVLALAGGILLRKNK